MCWLGGMDRVQVCFRHLDLFAHMPSSWSVWLISSLSLIKFINLLKVKFYFKVVCYKNLYYTNSNALSTRQTPGGVKVNKNNMMHIMHMCSCAYMHANTLCMHTYMNMNMHTQTQTQTCTRTHTVMHVCLQTHTHTYVRAHRHTRVRTFARIHAVTRPSPPLP